MKHTALAVLAFLVWHVRVDYVRQTAPEGEAPQYVMAVYDMPTSSKREALALARAWARDGVLIPNEDASLTLIPPDKITSLTAYEAQ